MPEDLRPLLHRSGPDFGTSDHSGFVSRYFVSFVGQTWISKAVFGGLRSPGKPTAREFPISKEIRSRHFDADIGANKDWFRVPPGVLTV